MKGGIGIGSVKELGESKNKDVLEGHGDDSNFSTLAESTGKLYFMAMFKKDGCV
jgi:hypothetical protein